MDYIEIGKIVNTHGILGQLKIKSYSNLDRFKKNCIIYILFNDQFIEEKIKYKNFSNGFEIVELFNYNNINDVLKYKGCNVYIKKEQQLPLTEGYYYHELTGKNVINQNNVLRGTVKEVLEYPNCDMLIINMENSNKTKLVPFIKEFIIEVTNDFIRVNEIEGLL